MDLIHLKLYWYGTEPQRGIYRSNLDGSQQELFASYNNVSRLSHDWGGGYVHWVDPDLDVILRQFTSGGGPIVEMSRDIANQRGHDVDNLWSVAVDSSRRTFFFTANNPSPPAIWRASSVNTVMESVASGDGSESIAPKEIAFNRRGGDIYWTDSISESLFRTTRSGVESKIISSGFSDFVNGLAVDADGERLYWTNQQLGVVYSAKLDGSDVRQIASGYESIQGIIVGPPVPEPTTAILGVMGCVALAAVARRRRSPHPLIPVAKAA